MTVRGLCALVALSFAVQGVAGAQTLAPPPPDFSQAPASAATSVTLVTFGSGTEVFERFGHNALWFHNPGALQDSAFHWGLFSFNEPHFLARFLTGDNRYWTAP